MLDVAHEHDAVILGAVGGVQHPEERFDARPEAALFPLRKGLDHYLNLRPIRAVEALVDRSPPDRAGAGN